MEHGQPTIGELERHAIEWVRLEWDPEKAHSLGWQRKLHELAESLTPTTYPELRSVGLSDESLFDWSDYPANPHRDGSLHIVQHNVHDRLYRVAFREYRRLCIALQDAEIEEAMEGS